MKTIVTIALLFIAGYSVAQSRAQIDIPIVKEDTKVDSLMDIVLSKSKPGYIYFLINTTLLDDRLFNVFQLDTKDSSINLPQPQKNYLQGVVCFNYRGNVIFVGSNHYPAGLFSKTAFQKKFNFTWNEKTFSENKNNLYQGFFEYYAHKFTDMKTYFSPEKGEKKRPE